MKIGVGEALAETVELGAFAELFVAEGVEALAEGGVLGVLVGGALLALLGEAFDLGGGSGAGLLGVGGVALGELVLEGGELVEGALELGVGFGVGPGELLERVGGLGEGGAGLLALGGARAGAGLGRGAGGDEEGGGE